MRTSNLLMIHSPRLFSDPVQPRERGVGPATYEAIKHLRSLGHRVFRRGRFFRLDGASMVGVDLLKFHRKLCPCSARQAGARDLGAERALSPPGAPAASPPLNQCLA